MSVLRCLNVITDEGLARSHRWDALTSEEHWRSPERDVVTADSTTRRHSPDAWESHVSWKLSQQPSRPTAVELPHDTGPPCWGEGAVSTSERWSYWTNSSSHWGLHKLYFSITALHVGQKYNSCCFIWSWLTTVCLETNCCRCRHRCHHRCSCSYCCSCCWNYCKFGLSLQLTFFLFSENFRL